MGLHDIAATAAVGGSAPGFLVGVAAFTVGSGGAGVGVVGASATANERCEFAGGVADATGEASAVVEAAGVAVI